MKIKLRFAIWIVVVELLVGLPTNSEARKDYTLEDFRYFKPMIADIRTQIHQMRFYRSDAIDFSNAEAIEDHLFWDVSYGGSFPIYGYNFEYDSEKGPAENSMEISGITTFIETSAHMLLDFDAESDSVISMDFRIGGGVSLRLPRWFKNIAFRYKFFHESTHLGDEYALDAVRLFPVDFRRYNVSYEAHDLFASLDHYTPWGKKGLPFRIAYLRGYGGHRFFTKEGSFPEFNGQGGPLKASDNESQVGAEIYLRGWEKQSGPLLFRRLKFQYLVAAADFYYRDRYDLDTPEKIWSTNFVVGVVYGYLFEGKRTLKFLLNYYNGVHPHGQLRNGEIQYVGISVATDF